MNLGAQGVACGGLNLAQGQEKSTVGIRCPDGVGLKDGVGFCTIPALAAIREGARCTQVEGKVGAAQGLDDAIGFNAIPCPKRLGF